MATERTVLADAGSLRLTQPKAFGFVEELGGLPIALSEFHLSSHFFPLAVRFRGDRPELHVIVAPGYLRKPLIAPDGDWLGGYRPLSLRAQPFELSENAAGDPLRDVVLPRSSPLLGAAGVPLLENGAPSAMMLKLHEMLSGVRQSARQLVPVLDRLFMAELMVPLLAGSRAEAADPFFVVDRDRFVALSGRGLRAMARADFHAVEIAVACIFSQRLLKPERLAQRSNAAASDRPSDANPADYTPFLTGLSDLPAVLDEGDLFSFDDLDSLHLSVD
jgi:hypothetical protein